MTKTRRDALMITTGVLFSGFVTVALVFAPKNAAPNPCHPGYHPIDFVFRGAHAVVCSADVPGDGLPWDTANLVCFIGLMAAVVIFCGYLGWLTWRERNIK